MFDWNDLRHFLAVARTGTTLGAARLLGTSQPTVVRRIAAFEAAAGTILFERRRTGYSLTAAGREIRPLAERVEAEVETLAAGLAAQSRRLAGTIRVTVPEAIANTLVAPVIVAFRRSHPDVEVQTLIDDRYLDIARGEADMAIRATSRGLGSSELVGRVLSDAPWAVYCSRLYADQAGRPASIEELRGHALIGGEGPVGQIPALRWIEDIAPGGRLAGRSTSLTNLHAAVRSGLGISALPCLLGGTDPSLLKCFKVAGSECNKVWVVTRDEIRRLPHARAFIDALVAHFRLNAPLLLGEGPGEAASDSFSMS